MQCLFNVEVHGLTCIECSTGHYENSDCDNGKTSFQDKYKHSCPNGFKCFKTTQWYTDKKPTEVAHKC